VSRNSAKEARKRIASEQRVVNARLIAVAAGVAGRAEKGDGRENQPLRRTVLLGFSYRVAQSTLLDARARGSHPRRERKRALAALAAIVAPVSAVSITRDLVVTSVGASSLWFPFF